MIKLYKYNHAGKVLEYHITGNSRDGETYIETWSGQKNGKLTYNYIPVIPKGGRTPDAQLELELNSRINKLKDDGYAETLDKANTDQLGRIKPMLASPYKESLIRFPCYVQPKYDGVRCVAILHEGQVHLVSRNGKTYNIKHILEYLNEHQELLPLDGELYSPELTFQEITSAVKKHNSNTEKLKLVVYDKPVEGPFKERVELIKGLGGPLETSPMTMANNLGDVIKAHDEYVSNGFEGAIIRNTNGLYINRRSKDLIKLKSFLDSEFIITGYDEGTGRDKGTVIWICKHNDKEFRVRPSGSYEYRHELLLNAEKYKGALLTVKYQELTDGGLPRFPVGISIRDYE